VRRACTLFKVARSALSYWGRKAARDAPVVERMREVSAQYPRYGYRRIRIFLGRAGYRMSPGRAYRLWLAAGLQLPRKRPKKRVAAAWRDRKRRVGRTRYGPMISCSIIVPMASNSSA
jgi:putative transposase